MYFQIESVLEKYNLEDSSISKGRQILLCEKDHKLYALKEYFGTEKKAEFLYQLGTFLKNEGWSTDCLVKNKEGGFFTEGVDGVKYTLHQWYRGRECDIKNPQEILLAVKELARFHKQCQTFEWEPVSTADDPLEVYRRHERELKKIYQFILKRKKKTDFEQLYINCFKEFYGQCQEICGQMEEKKLHLTAEQQYVCHGDFQYHNVWFLFGKPLFLQFSKAGYGLQIFDLCNFMRKILEKNGWDTGLGISMITEYDKVNPISEGTFWQMYYRMAFPEKFWKLANRYYVSNKAWISRQNYEKLQVEIRQNARRLHYLERMLYFCENMY